MRVGQIRILAVATTLVWAGAAGAHAGKLPALGADPARVSLSGLSSGGFVAQQYAVAYSASVVGVGVVAAGPYNCAYVTIGGVAACMQGAPLGVASVQAALDFAALGQIDSVDGLAKQRVYLFSGEDDPLVRTGVVDTVRDFFTGIGTPAANIQFRRDIPAGHALVSAAFGADCSTTASPFVVQCTVGGEPYDQPGAVLSWIYGPLQPRATHPSAKPTPFSQSSFASARAAMAKTGYVYIPAACRAAGAKCAIHVVLHGCAQSASMVADAVYEKVGFNALADANGIIVLYPQVDPGLLNPQGCWDWWGYTGADFQVRTGAQLKAIHAMIAQLEKTPGP